MGNPHFVSNQDLQRPTCREFCTDFSFDQSATVILQNQENKFSVRVDQRDTNQLDGSGLLGTSSRWMAKMHSDNQYVSLQNKRTKRYMRMWEDQGQVHVDAKGVAGDKEHDDRCRDGACRWKVHKHHAYVRLESRKYPGKYLAVEDGEVRVGTGGKYTRLTVKSQHE